MVKKHMDTLIYLIWKRINDFIIKNDLDVVNIESIVLCKFLTGGATSIVSVSNDNSNIIGHRLYYRKQYNQTSIILSKTN